ncbi:MAG TPA: hypothetical protein VL943_05185 [Niabella sp.]|nr:hypothetical protein [Niabella sp.]
MNPKFYSILRLLLGIFILLGIMETGNTLANHYRRNIQITPIHPVITLNQQQKPLKQVVLYCSQLIDSTQKHLS